MFGAKIKLSHDIAHQKSTKGAVLEWMQENPQLCKNTNATAIAKALVNSKGVLRGTTAVAVRQAICSMVNNQMITRFGNKRRANFYINYLHKDIPPYVLENAPKEERERRKAIEEGLDINQRLDDAGCIVTEPQPDDAETQEVETKEDKSSELDDIIEKVIKPFIAQKETTVVINLNINM